MNNKDRIDFWNSKIGHLKLAVERQEEQRKKSRKALEITKYELQCAEASLSILTFDDEKHENSKLSFRYLFSTDDGTEYEIPLVRKEETIGDAKKKLQAKYGTLKDKTLAIFCGDLALDDARKLCSLSTMRLRLTVEEKEKKGTDEEEYVSELRFVTVASGDKNVVIPTPAKPSIRPKRENKHCIVDPDTTSEILFYKSIEDVEKRNHFLTLKLPTSFFTGSLCNYGLIVNPTYKE